MPQFRYNRNEDLIEITVRDVSGRKVFEARCNGRDHETYGRILRFMADKFGYHPIASKNVEKKDDFFDF